jgi:hypothetical protein
MKAYKFNKGYFLNKKSLVTKDNILVIDKVTKDNLSCKIQGKSGNTNISQDLFNKLITDSYVSEVEITENDYYSLVEMPSSLKNKKDILTNLKKMFPSFEKMVDTLETWIFQAKGSDCATYNDWINFIKNPVLENMGFKSKPGKPVMNRSQRNTSISDESMWSNDFTCILPYGIRKSDFADFFEQEKIFDKLFLEFLSLNGIPDEMIAFVLSNESFSDKKINKSSHRDYYTKELLDVSLFSKNEHHSKEKGLELCHIDPTLEFNTIAENLTIGLSSSNREQGGYSILRRECAALRTIILKIDDSVDMILKVNNLVEKEDLESLISILVGIKK